MLLYRVFHTLLFSTSVVVIGFVNTDFSVSEAAGAVSFDLRVLEGMIAPELGDVIVTLSTIERTAEGPFIESCSALYIITNYL